jgi:hypothetical protein
MDKADIRTSVTSSDSWWAASAACSWPIASFRARNNQVAFRGGLNRSAQHSNLLAEMECEHEAATSHLLFCGSAV